MALPKLYTREETSEYLRKSVRSLDRLVADKKISFIVDGRLIRFTEFQIQQYLDSRTIKAKKTA